MGTSEIELLRFGIMYALVAMTALVMHLTKRGQSLNLLIASVRMSLQLIIAGFLLTWIFSNPHPMFVVAYILVMTAFAIYITLSKNKDLGLKFKFVVAASLSFTSIAVIVLFVIFLVGEDIFNAQYTIPLAGMIMGNAMTGISLALRAFKQGLADNRLEIQAMLNYNVKPLLVLKPFVSKALQTALVPTLNSMLGMGIVFLPGMMTGQLLSGTLPNIAIIYQISIMFAIIIVTYIASSACLYFGSITMVQTNGQIAQFKQNPTAGGKNV